jgi:hypothetical protein
VDSPGGDGLINGAVPIENIIKIGRDMQRETFPIEAKGVKGEEVESWIWSLMLAKFDRSSQISAFIRIFFRSA